LQALFVISRFGERSAAQSLVSSTQLEASFYSIMLGFVCFRKVISTSRANYVLLSNVLNFAFEYIVVILNGDNSNSKGVGELGRVNK
jgi:hypothetical protein